MHSSSRLDIDYSPSKDRHTHAADKAARHSTGTARTLLNIEKYIVIQGHSSGEGSDQYNYLLSEQRAEAVKTHLINLGIDSSRIKIQAFGSEKPLYEENSERNIILNRRIEIIFE